MPEPNFFLRFSRAKLPELLPNMAISPVLNREPDLNQVQGSEFYLNRTNSSVQGSPKTAMNRTELDFGITNSSIALSVLVLSIESLHGFVSLAGVAGVTFRSRGFPNHSRGVLYHWFRSDP
jgi:hypothetical protein